MESASTSLIEIIPADKPKSLNAVLVDKVVADVVKVPLTEKEKISLVLSSLESIRLSMDDTEGQGFLFNASACIRLYLQLK